MIANLAGRIESRYGWPFHETCSACPSLSASAETITGKLLPSLLEFIYGTKKCFIGKIRIVLAAAVNHGVENESQWLVAFDSNAAQIALFHGRADSQREYRSRDCATNFPGSC